MAIRGMPAVVQVGTGARVLVAVVVVIDAVQVGCRTRLSTCRAQSSQAIVVGIRRTSCALRCVVTVYRRRWLG